MVGPCLDGLCLCRVDTNSQIGSALSRMVSSTSTARITFSTKPLASTSGRHYVRMRGSRCAGSRHCVMQSTILDLTSIPFETRSTAGKSYSRANRTHGTDWPSFNLILCMLSILRATWRAIGTRKGSKNGPEQLERVEQARRTACPAPTYLLGTRSGEQTTQAITTLRRF